MPETLPSAFYRGTRQSNILPSAALSKIKAPDKGGFAECQPLGKAWLSVKLGAALGKDPTRQKVAGP